MIMLGESLAVSGSRVFVANYFSDSLEVVDLAQLPLKAKSSSLGVKGAMSVTQGGRRAWRVTPRSARGAPIEQSPVDRGAGKHRSHLRSTWALTSPDVITV